MATTLTATFADPVQANRAVADLLSSGLSKDDISLVVGGHAREKFAQAGQDTGDRMLKDAALGAGTGGAFAALVLGLTTIGGVIVPGLPIMAAGPIVAALEGFGGGAIVGGAAGALSALGIKSAEASDVEKDLKAGHAVVVVTTNDVKKLTAAELVLKDVKFKSRAA